MSVVLRSAVKKFRVKGLVYLAREERGEGEHCTLAKMTLDNEVLRLQTDTEEVTIPVKNIVSVDTTASPGGGRIVKIRYQSTEKLKVNRIVIAGLPSPLELAYKVIRRAIERANQDLPLGEGGQIDQEDVKLLYLLFVKREQFNSSLVSFLLNVDKNALREKIDKLKRKGLIGEDLRISRRGLELLKVRKML